MDYTELRKEIKESRESFASKEEECQLALDYKDIDLEYYRSTMIIQKENTQITNSLRAPVPDCLCQAGVMSWSGVLIQ